MADPYRGSRKRRHSASPARSNSSRARKASLHEAKSAVDGADQVYFCPAPDGTFIPVKTTRIVPAGSYDVILLIDHREMKRAMDDVYLHRRLTEKGIEFERRQLVLGDYLWIARASDGTEYLLDCIIERKRMDDLCSSIRDGRFAEQKHRLHNSGLANVHYVFEDYDKRVLRDEFRNWHVKPTPLSSTIVEDQFMVKETCDVRDTIDYIKNIHEALSSTYETVDLRIIPTDQVTRDTWPALQQTLRKGLPSHTFVPTYEAHRIINSKDAGNTVGSSFARFLLCIRGCSQEKVAVLVEHYGTLHGLCEAFKVAEELEQEGLAMESRTGFPSPQKGKRKAGSAVPRAKDMLTELGGSGRKKIGKNLSERIYEAFMAEEYPSNDIGTAGSSDE